MVERSRLLPVGRVGSCWGQELPWANGGGEASVQGVVVVMGGSPAPGAVPVMMAGGWGLWGPAGR